MVNDSSERVSKRTSVGGSIFTYFREVLIEMGKVRWPKRRELFADTLTVVVLSLVIFLLTYGFDVLVTHGMQLIGIANG